MWNPLNLHVHMSQIGRHPENTSKQRRKRARHCERGMGERGSRGIYMICTNIYVWNTYHMYIYTHINYVYTYNRHHPENTSRQKRERARDTERGKKEGVRGQCISVYMYTCMYIYTYIYIYIHTCTYIHVYYIDTYTTYMYEIQIYIHTYKYTLIDTYIYTHKYIITDTYITPAKPQFSRDNPS